MKDWLLAALLLFGVAFVFFPERLGIEKWPSEKSGIETSSVVKPLAIKEGMVASAQSLATEVGLDVLERGGNAIDAAVATAFALGVVEPYASGIGGGGLMLIYLSKERKAVAIDYLETAPSSATERMFLNRVGNPMWDQMLKGPRSIAVPGMVAGMALALKQYGTKTFSTLIQPSIRLAENGYTVNSLFSSMMNSSLQKLLTNPEASRIYLKHGRPYRVGDQIQLEDLARTYRLLAAEGADVFYKGDIAEAISKELGRLKGLITREDLAAYHTVLRDPVSAKYRDYDIVSAPPPSSGGTLMLGILNVLEGYDLRQLGQNSPDSIELFVEAMKHAYSDRVKFMGDPDFVDIPVQMLLSKTYAREQREKLRTSRAVDESRIANESDDTTQVCVVDEIGNVVSLTQTINSFFASGIVVPGTGILLNNRMFDFDPLPGRADSIAPRKRPETSMAPSIVFKNRQPVLAIGTPGASRIISGLPQILVNIFDFGMGIQAAITAPRIHGIGNEVLVESRIPVGVRHALTEKGYKVTVMKDFDVYFGGAQGIMIGRSGVLHGGADPRRHGFVEGY